MQFEIKEIKYPIIKRIFAWYPMVASGKIVWLEWIWMSKPGHFYEASKRLSRSEFMENGYPKVDY